MIGFWILGYLGFALLYGGLASLALLGLARLAGRFPGWHVLPFLIATLFFVFLTLHPFPDPATLTCPVATAMPQLKPLGFLDTVAQLNRRQVSWRAYVLNQTLVATVMNFVFCLPIGLALARHVARLRHAALFALALTLTVELTQLTGGWGLWPCAWRQFNVDDLMMNAAGVIAGFVPARAILRRRAAGRARGAGPS